MLAERLDVSPVAIPQHLTTLEALGLVVARAAAERATAWLHLPGKPTRAGSTR